jgi:hypothetical protein
MMVSQEVNGATIQPRAGLGMGLLGFIEKM